jgi:hypothetical protein
VSTNKEGSLGMSASKFSFFFVQSCCQRKFFYTIHILRSIPTKQSFFPPIFPMNQSTPQERARCIVFVFSSLQLATAMRRTQVLYGISFLTLVKLQSKYLTLKAYIRQSKHSFSLCKKKISRHIKMSANVWSTKCR